MQRPDGLGRLFLYLSCCPQVAGPRCVPPASNAASGGGAHGLRVHAAKDPTAWFCFSPTTMPSAHLKRQKFLTLWWELKPWGEICSWSRKQEFGHLQNSLLLTERVTEVSWCMGNPKGRRELHFLTLVAPQRDSNICSQV